MPDPALPEEPDPLLRPVWADLPDDPLLSHPAGSGRSDGAISSRRGRHRGSTLSIEDPAGLLAPLAAAQDALARLDARAEAAPPPIRTGLIARLALHEAAGWLASRHAWVHPHDLALRVENLAGRFDTAAQIARPRQTLPSTFATAPGGWDDPEDFAALAQGETAVVRALALARRLTALPRQHNPLATATAAAGWLGPLGAGALDADRFAAWRAAAWPGHRHALPAAALPPLLQAADTALAWMESGADDQPDALVALALAALRLTRDQALRVIPLPCWAAWPALGQLQDEGLPRLRPAVAARLTGMERVPWPLGFLAFATEAARMGLRELDRLHAAATAGQALAAGLDRRARLPAVVDLVLAQPVVTPRGLAGRLDITLQAANRILATLAQGSVVKEVTGRGSFRAYAI